MNRSLVLGLATTVLVGISGVSHADLVSDLPFEYRDIDWVGEKVTVENPVSGMFDISADDGEWWDRPGYVADTPISSAAVGFLLTDDYDSKSGPQGEAYLIEISGDGVASGTEQPLGPGVLGRWLTFVWGEVSVQLLMDLEEDGQLAWEARATEGDYMLWKVGLGANVDRSGISSNRNGVPDGGSSLLLLGGALLGVACFRRR